MSGPVEGSGALVVRSEVPEYSEYIRYRPFLRKDFFYSCAYCTLTEFEALGIRFTIDHYEPRSSRPDLECDYDNLMYACGECNLRKGDLSPPSDARDAGLRFFRADKDIVQEHFTLEYRVNGWNLEGVSPVGEFTVEFLDLNRQWLLRLRELRHKLEESVEFVAYGVQSLRSIPIDQLPVEIKAKASAAIKKKIALMEHLENSVDAILRAIAKSDLLDEDPLNEERARQRSQKMLGNQALFPGIWRGRGRRKARKPVPSRPRGEDNGQAPTRPA